MDRECKMIQHPWQYNCYRAMGNQGQWAPTASAAGTYKRQVSAEETAGAHSRGWC